jgi:hypothetical protein
LGEDVFAAFEEELYFSRDPYTASARHIDAFLSATHSTLGYAYYLFIYLFIIYRRKLET